MEAVEAVPAVLADEARGALCWLAEGCEAAEATEMGVPERMPASAEREADREAEGAPEEARSASMSRPLPAPPATSKLPPPMLPTPPPHRWLGTEPCITSKEAEAAPGCGRAPPGTTPRLPPFDPLAAAGARALLLLLLLLAAV